VRASVRAALRHGGREHLEVDVALVSDEELASIHDRFLDDPSPTDVISFDLGEDGDGPAAEVYASVDRAIEVARKRGSGRPTSSGSTSSTALCTCAASTIASPANGPACGARSPRSSRARAREHA
jgi:hypothetical protein